MIGARENPIRGILVTCTACSFPLKPCNTNLLPRADKVRVNDLACVVVEHNATCLRIVSEKAVAIRLALLAFLVRKRHLQDGQGGGGG